MPTSIHFIGGGVLKVDGDVEHVVEQVTRGAFAAVEVGGERVYLRPDAIAYLEAAHIATAEGSDQVAEWSQPGSIPT